MVLGLINKSNKSISGLQSLTRITGSSKQNVNELKLHIANTNHDAEDCTMVERGTTIHTTVKSRL